MDLSPRDRQICDATDFFGELLGATDVIEKKIRRLRPDVPMAADKIAAVLAALAGLRDATGDVHDCLGIEVKRIEAAIDAECEAYHAAGGRSVAA